MEQKRTIRKRLVKAMGAAALGALALGLLGSAQVQPRDPNWAAGQEAGVVVELPAADQGAGLAAPMDTQWG
ncbi:hypothetical protein ACIRLA_28910 [Streptomyces sp. NPDC102364]|uniref:hypothetical protein n=1 Tax=Streptomyces sp. NPDC102364 TaxID=3366161 RepID=UPI00380D8FFC